MSEIPWKSFAAVSTIDDPHVAAEFKAEIEKCVGDEQRASNNFIMRKIRAFIAKCAEKAEE